MSDARIEDIGACVFDAYGTLFDFHAAAKRCRDELGEKADPLSALWRTKQMEYTWLRGLLGRHVDFWQVTGDGLDFAMSALDIENPALREKLMNLYLELDTFPEVVDVLTRLKEGGFKTAILSNGSPMMLEAAVNGAGIAELLDAVLSVEKVGVYKPHPSVYKMATDWLGAPASRICYQSSNAWDAFCPAALGFKVVWCNRYGQRPERLPGQPVAEVRTLAELPSLLGL